MVNPSSIEVQLALVKAVTLYLSDTNQTFVSNGPESPLSSLIHTSSERMDKASFRGTGIDMHVDIIDVSSSSKDVDTTPVDYCSPILLLLHL